jgi:endonuclease/exonuclease/phosphatase family metal-dependent hydrolase
MPRSSLLSLVLAPAASLFLALPSLAQEKTGAAPPSIKVLDGKFDDWTKTPRESSITDPVGDAGDDPTVGSDLKQLVLEADGKRLHLLLATNKPSTIQGLEKPLVIYLDADGDESTGAKPDAEGDRLAGADVAIVFSPRVEGSQGGDRRPPRGEGEGVAIFAVSQDGELGDRRAADSIGLGMAPTCASDRYELRIDRSADFLAGGKVRAMAVTLKGDTVADRTKPVACELPAFDPRPFAPAEASAVARPARTDARIVTWNAERGALFTGEKAEAFGSTLAAIAPDVILLQELGAKATSQSLSEWLDRHVPRESKWNAIVSGGDLRTAVASTFPLESASFLDGVTRETDKGKRPVRVAAATVDVKGKKLLALSVHLKCCGNLDSDEDRTRMDEARTIAANVAKSLERSKADGVVIGGDLNLVGSDKVLEALGEKADVDRTDLAVAEIRQLDGASNQTWRSSGNAFAPGRLDYLLVSDRGLDRRGAFVFSEEDLSRIARTTLKLPESAFDEPSDHQPVVVDVAFAKR